MDKKEWDGNGWTKYQLLVLSQLETHHRDLNSLNAKISDLRVEISALKVQAGIWGLIAGIIPAAVALIMMAISSHSK